MLIMIMLDPADIVIFRFASGASSSDISISN